MISNDGYVVETIDSTGATVGGEFVRLTMVLESDGGGHPLTVLFPYQMMGAMMAALMGATAAAHAEMVKAMGSDENVANLLGLPSFAPDAVECGRGYDATGKDYILVRLRRDGAPMVDVTFTPNDAAVLHRALGEEIARGPGPRKSWS